MNDSIARMGVLYGKLGLSTNPELIAARSEAVKAAAEEVQAEDLPLLLRFVFGLQSSDSSIPFLEQFKDADPTFAVEATDKEASLLCGAILSYEIQSESVLSPQAAMMLAAAAFGNTRKPEFDDQLVATAEQFLADAQMAEGAALADRTYGKAPKKITEALAALPAAGAVDVTILKPLFEDLVKYSESGALAAAKGDNQLLAYVRRLEEELRTYWWVTSGWSNELKMSFRDIDIAEASILVGLELAKITSLQLGLHAAPALCDMVLSIGKTNLKKFVTLSEIAIAPDLAIRKSYFGKIAESVDGVFLPLTSAMGMAANSDDASDWEPRYTRLTGIDTKVKLKPLDLANQMYREHLAAKFFN